jgi:Trk K+ transport system NAD-binding subunit
MVIGLGRFGSAAAEGLVALGQEVIGVDASDARVQHHMNLLGQVVQANGADLDAMTAKDGRDGRRRRRA